MSAEWRRVLARGHRAILLQRGRAQLSAEWSSCSSRNVTGSPWLQRGRAQLSAECDQVLASRKAASGLQRGRAQLSAECSAGVGLTGRVDTASTGPRSIERGMAENFGQVLCVNGTGQRVLQRGRAQLSAECGDDVGRLDAALKLQRGRAQLSAECSYPVVGVWKPSMLQRGRAQLSAECRGLATAQKPNHMLQRGRAQLSAECSSNSGFTPAGRKASTGPRSIERGMPVLGLAGGGPPVGASTGPRSIERGMISTVGAGGEHGAASTGPRSIERGMIPLYFQRVSKTAALQRGRAQLSAEWRWIGSCGGRNILLQRGRAQLSAECSISAAVIISYEMLQRGRAQLSAECTEQRSVQLRGVLASTGPRSIERGMIYLDRQA